MISYLCLISTLFIIAIVIIIVINYLDKSRITDKIKNFQSYIVMLEYHMKKAYDIADEWDYNGKRDKIAVGVIYQKETNKAMEEEWPQLKKLREKGVGWKGLR